MESVLAARLRRPPLALLGDLRRLRRPTPRSALLAFALAALLGSGFLLFRDSSFVAVEQVQISGVQGVESAAVSQALEAAARRMSTLDFSASELEAAVASYPVVRSLQVSTSFPHRMRILVVEQLPVAQISAAGVHTAVAADGVVLGPALVSRSLPSIPASVAPRQGRRVSEGRLLAYLTILGAAPRPLLALVTRIYAGPQGLTVRLRNGLLVYFGDASRAHAKWDALIAVLLDPSSVGASYVDLRMPERPAAGVPSGGVGSGEAAGVSASDPTSAALAASLAKAVNGEPAAAPTSTSTASAPAAASSEPAAAGTEPGQEATPPAGQEPAAPGSQEATAPAGGEAAAPASQGAAAPAAGETPPATAAAGASEAPG